MNASILRFLTLLLMLMSSSAAAQARRTRSTAWDGLSALVALGGEVGVAVLPLGSVDVSTLRPDTALLIVHPTGHLPPRALSTYLQAGGRVGLFDDYGSGESLLRAFGIARLPYIPTSGVPTLRGNAQLPLATPVSNHPLSQGVRTLATNHPRTLHHSTLEPVFNFAGNGDNALVLTGAVGNGRLVAGADESVLANHMLVLRGNRRFARNVLRYLTEGGATQVLLLADDANIEGGALAEGGRGAVARLRAALRDAARRVPSTGAVRIGTWAIAVGLLLAAASALPKSKAYGRIHRHDDSGRTSSRSHEPSTSKRRN